MFEHFFPAWVSFTACPILMNCALKTFRGIETLLDLSSVQFIRKGARNEYTRSYSSFTGSCMQGKRAHSEETMVGKTTTDVWSANTQHFSRHDDHRPRETRSALSEKQNKKGRSFHATSIPKRPHISPRSRSNREAVLTRRLVELVERPDPEPLELTLRSRSSVGNLLMEHGRPSPGLYTLGGNRPTHGMRASTHDLGC